MATPNIAARTRAGIGQTLEEPAGHDPRIAVSLKQLLSLTGQARSLRLLPRQLSRSALNGRHASRLRGRGLSFEELRHYLPGDDIRTIDWKVTARAGEPYVRVYSEERDRPTLIAVDQRMSMFFGSVLNMKSVTACESGALLAAAAAAQSDRVGGIVFGDAAIAEIKPRRGRNSLHQLTLAMVNANRRLHAEAPNELAMILNRPLEALARIARRDNLVVLISDFDGIDDQSERLVSQLARRNDLILVPVTDPSSKELPEGFKVVASDGVLQAEFDTDSGALRQAIATHAKGRLDTLLGWQRKYGLSLLPLSAGEATLRQLQRLLGLMPAP